MGEGVKGIREPLVSLGTKTCVYMYSIRSRQLSNSLMTPCPADAVHQAVHRDGDPLDGGVSGVPPQG